MCNKNIDESWKKFGKVKQESFFSVFGPYMNFFLTLVYIFIFIQFPSSDEQCDVKKESEKNSNKKLNNTNYLK